jgi:hypothetical protein
MHYTQEKKSKIKTHTSAGTAVIAPSSSSSSTFTLSLEIAIPMAELAISGILPHLSLSSQSHNTHPNIKSHKSLHCEVSTFDTPTWSILYKAAPPPNQQQQQHQGAEGEQQQSLFQHFFALYVLEEACHLEVWVVNKHVTKDSVAVLGGANGRVVLDKERKRIVSPVIVLHSEVKGVEEKHVPKIVRRVKRGKSPILISIV